MGVKYKRTVVPRLTFDYYDLDTRIGVYCAVNRISRLKFASVLGLTYNSLRLKIRGLVPFTSFEIYILKNKLGIKDEEVCSVFLSPLVEK